MKRRFSLLVCLLCFATVITNAQNTTPYWSIAGNSNTDLNAKLGTTNAIPLNIVTNNQSRIRIGHNGRVGVGTGDATPATLFQVNGFGSFGNRATTLNATRALNLADTAAVMRILRVHPTFAPAVELMSRTTADGVNNAYWDFYAEPTDASFRIRDRKGGGSGLDRITISSPSGFVGVGTTTPFARFHVNGNGAFGGRVTKESATRALNLIDEQAVMRILRVHPTNAPAIELISRKNIDSGDIAYWDMYTEPSDGSLRFRDRKTGATNLNRLTISGPNGDVGIGTIFPSAKLEVKQFDGQHLVSKFTNESSSGDRSALVAVQNGDKVQWKYGVGGSGNSFGLDKGQFYIEQPDKGPLLTITKEGDVRVGAVTQEGTWSGSLFARTIGVGNISTSSIYISPSHSEEDYNVIHIDDGGGAGRGVGMFVESYFRDGVNAHSVWGTGVVGSTAEGLHGVIGFSSFGTGVVGSSFYGGRGIAGYSSAAWDLNPVGDVTGIYGSVNFEEPSHNPAYAGYFNGDVYTSGLYQGSDSKLKQNIADFSSAMRIINKLQPKSYEYRRSGDFKLMNLPTGKHYGLIAQDVENVLPELVKQSRFNVSLERAYASIRPDSQQTYSVVPVTEIIDFKVLNYTELIPIMVKAMQEQDVENRELKRVNEEIKKKNEELEARLQKLEALFTQNNNYNNTIRVSSAYLEQNMPNPTSRSTIIRYFLPENSSSSKLTLTNSKGQLLKTISLTGRGTGQVNLDTSALSAGVYNYALWVAGREVDTKKLVVTP